MTKYTVLAVLVLAVGCAQVQPFVDARREAGQVEPVGQSRPDRIAVCYNPLWDKDDAVAAVAQGACAPKNAVYEDKAYFNCRLLTPNTAFYRCEPLK